MKRYNIIMMIIEYLYMIVYIRSSIIYMNIYIHAKIMKTHTFTFIVV